MTKMTRKRSCYWKRRQNDSYLKHKINRPERIIKVYVPVFVYTEEGESDMKRMSNRALTGIVTLLICSVMAASCNINTDKAGEAFQHLGENLDNAVNGTEAETEAPAEETEVTETSEAEETEAPEEEAEPTPIPEPTATPTPTPSPTPTPEPEPERVDFSELTEDELADGVTVELEDFEESYVSEDDITLITFTGNRILISEEALPNVQTSVNLILDGFYLEAEGIYNRYTSEALAEIAMPMEEDVEFAPYSVTCGYEYGYNGRVLSVVMTYDVTRGDLVVEEHTEYASFDMYTGQYVTTASVVEDQELFRTTCGNILAFATENEEDNQDSFTDIFIFVEGSGNGVYVVGTAPDGTIVRALADIENIAPALNRYGQLLYTNR